MTYSPRTRGARLQRPSDETHRLDVVPVGVEQEGGVVAVAVVRPRPGRPVVAAAALQALAMELLHALAVLRAEGDVGAGADGLVGLVEPERSSAGFAEAGVAVALAVEPIAQSTEHRLIEADAGLQIAHLDADVIEHVCKLLVDDGKDARQRPRCGLGESCGRRGQRVGTPKARRRRRGG